MTIDNHQTPRRRHLSRSLLFAAAGLFLTAAALAVVKPPEEALEPIYAARQPLDLAPLDVAPVTENSPYIASARIQRGDTVSDLLMRLGVNEEGLLAFLTHDKNARSIYKLIPGRMVQAALDDNANMLWFRYEHTPGIKTATGAESAWLEVRPDNQGSFVAEERKQAARLDLRMAEGVITSSLFGAADQAQIPDSITLEMVEILASRIDFMKDLRKNDQFRIVYEVYTHNGVPVASGNIRALEFINNNKTYTAVWFDNGKDPGAYYDFSGASLKGAFLRNSIKFTRISSRFGMRKHPIHKKWTGHKGVDYAAPSGTPIRATADGTVEFIGRKGGYGNVIILKNFGQYSTLYAHQSSFAKGLRKGSRVKQGDIIGYVGATGWATGPHLHYEFRIAGKPVDPLSVDLPVAQTLADSDRNAFKEIVASYRPQIELLTKLQDTRLQLARQ